MGSLLILLPHELLVDLVLLGEILVAVQNDLVSQRVLCLVVVAVLLQPFLVLAVRKEIQFRGF